MSQSDELKARAAVLVQELKKSGKYLMNSDFKFIRSEDTNISETIRLAREQLTPKPKRRTRRAKV